MVSIPFQASDIENRWGLNIHRITTITAPDEKDNSIENKNLQCAAVDAGCERGYVTRMRRYEQ